MTDAQLFGIGLVKSLLWRNFVKNPKKLTKDCVKTQKAVFTKLKLPTPIGVLNLEKSIL